jgi:hypothetical protein
MNRLLEVKKAQGLKSKNLWALAARLNTLRKKDSEGRAKARPYTSCTREVVPS